MTTINKLSTPSLPQTARTEAAKPAVDRATEAKDQFVALLPFELHKFELPFELPKIELPSLAEVQERAEHIVVDLRERYEASAADLRKQYETAVEKVRATIGR